MPCYKVIVHPKAIYNIAPDSADTGALCFRSLLLLKACSAPMPSAGRDHLSWALLLTYIFQGTSRTFYHFFAPGLLCTSFPSETQAKNWVGFPSLFSNPLIFPQKCHTKVYQHTQEPALPVFNVPYLIQKPPTKLSPSAQHLRAQAGFSSRQAKPLRANPNVPSSGRLPTAASFSSLGCLISAFWPILPARTLSSSLSDGIWYQTPICARVARGQQLPFSSPRAASASNGKSSQMMAQHPLWKLWVKLSGAFSPLFFPKS